MYCVVQPAYSTDHSYYSLLYIFPSPWDADGILLADMEAACRLKSFASQLEKRVGVTRPDFRSGGIQPFLAFALQGQRRVNYKREKTALSA